MTHESHLPDKITHHSATETKHEAKHPEHQEAAHHTAQHNEHQAAHKLYADASHHGPHAAAKVVHQHIEAKAIPEKPVITPQT